MARLLPRLDSVQGQEKQSIHFEQHVGAASAPLAPRYRPRQPQKTHHYPTARDHHETMLAEVLALQQDGDKAAADAFIKKYFIWDDVPHAALAESMKAAETYRYAVVRYAVLENK